MNSFRTIWITTVRIAIVIFLFTLITYWVADTYTFIQSVVGAFVLVFFYGSLFWIGFIVLLMTLDFLLAVPDLKNIKAKLLVEWAVISTPLIYWAINYVAQRKIFVAAVFTFFLMQMLREKMLKNTLPQR